MICLRNMARARTPPSEFGNAHLHTSAINNYCYYVNYRCLCEQLAPACISQFSNWESSTLQHIELSNALKYVMEWYLVSIRDCHVYYGLNHAQKSFLWNAIPCLLSPLRKEIVCYLGRPDHKQEFVSQWQQNYNAIPAHLISEDVMKAELHHRVDVSI